MSDSVSFADLFAQAEKDGIQFENVQPGEYEMYVKSAKGSRTSNGKMRIEATCAIIGGPNDGKTVWNQFVISPENGKALGFFFRHMAILGLGPDWWKPKALADGVIAQAANEIVGSRFLSTVIIKNVNGGDRNDLDKIAPSRLAPGQKFSGTGGGTAAPAGAMMPAGAPPIPSVATVPQPPAPAVVPQAVPAPEPEAVSAPEGQAPTPPPAAAPAAPF